jgi:hypothetical protein
MHRPVSLEALLVLRRAQNVPVVPSPQKKRDGALSVFIRRFANG